MTRFFISEEYFLWTSPLFRSLMAMLSAFSIGLLVSKIFIARLEQLQFGQIVREYGPKSHMSKMGTPTAGGLLILFSTLVSSLIWSDLSNVFIWIVLSVLVSYGTIGFLDDYLKIVKKTPDGVSAKKKIILQSILAVLFLFVLVFVFPINNSISGSIQESRIFFREIPFLLPFVSSFSISFFFLMVLGYFVLIGSSNAVNLTDGADGLAIMPSILVVLALAVLGYIAGSPKLAADFSVPFVSGATELITVCSALAGAGLSFLWFNAPPARIFMGDVGSLSIGAALGMIAIIIRQEIIFFIMSGVFVVETLSVILQVSYFKYTKYRYGTPKRIFRMAPVHHHFELTGIKETQVVIRFWIVSMIMVLVGLCIAFLQ